MARQLTPEDIQRIGAWKVRTQQAEDDLVAAERGLSAREVLPAAAVPDFDEDDERPLTAQGRALLARRRAARG